MCVYSAVRFPISNTQHLACTTTVNKLMWLTLTNKIRTLQEVKVPPLLMAPIQKIVMMLSDFASAADGWLTAD